MGRRARTLEERFWAHVRKGAPDECWLWEGACYPGGYGTMRNALGRVSTGAHRVSYTIHRGEIADGLDVLHACDTRYPKGDTTYRRCCNPAHLRTGTHPENMGEMALKGRSYAPRQLGVANGWAKLDEEKVREIRARAAAGESRRSLGQAFGVSSVAITNIVNRKRWPHVA